MTLARCRRSFASIVIRPSATATANVSNVVVERRRAAAPTDKDGFRSGIRTCERRCTLVGLCHLALQFEPRWCRGDPWLDSLGRVRRGRLSRRFHASAMRDGVCANFHGSAPETQTESLVHNAAVTSCVCGRCTQPDSCSRCVASECAFSLSARRRVVTHACKRRLDRRNHNRADAKSVFAGIRVL